MKTRLRKLQNTKRFYRDLFRFLINLGKIIASSHRNNWMRYRLLQEFNDLINVLNSKQPLVISTDDSKNHYNLYDDREIKDYFRNSSMMLLNNEPKLMTFREERTIHLSYIFAEIDQILKTKDKCKILEVGCGNCINIFEILEKYGDKVEITGIDIAYNRIEVAKKYFDLSKANLGVASITEKTNFKDGEFDLVFSMFCLEQIAYDVKSAVKEMHRISNNKVVMLEPVFENGNFLQKIYLILSDHTRILLKSIQELGFKISRNEIMEFQCNPSSQSTILVLDKD